MGLDLTFLYSSPSTDDSVHYRLNESLAWIQYQDKNLHFAFLAISMGVIASSLGPRVLMYMVLPISILLHCLHASQE